jgi:hypothetical protein
MNYEACWKETSAAARRAVLEPNAGKKRQRRQRAFQGGAVHMQGEASCGRDQGRSDEQRRGKRGGGGVDQPRNQTK